ncbi:MAG: GntR family transcriptional regulator [Deferribacteraceae bacterium]|jgi:GntR family transcriptional regulator|nr:GntR family transcriptional regulator [Deferribacteraceae bacterium]
MNDFINTIKLDKNTPIPLYYQLKRCVLAMLESSMLKEGDMLPPESELSEALGVSRPTIRQAFNELVSEGRLARYKGRGTFVSKPKVEARFLSKLETFNQEMHTKGMMPHTLVLALEKVTGPGEACEKLKLKVGAQMIYLKRLRSADDTPLVYVETYLPYEPFSRLMDVDFSEKSLYDSLEELYGVRVSHVNREIEAVNSHKGEAELLKIFAGKAVSFVKTVAYSESYPDPVEFSVAKYRGDLNKFIVDVYR